MDIEQQIAYLTKGAAEIIREEELRERLKAGRPLRVKAGFESSGYEVESVRLTTQPLAELVSGLSEEQSLAFLAELDELSVKENFLPNVGPAMLHDNLQRAVIRGEPSLERPLGHLVQAGMTAFAMRARLLEEAAAQHRRERHGDDP